MQDTLALENKKLVGAFVNEVFVKRNLSDLDRYMRGDYIQHNPMTKQGMDGFRKFFADWFNAVPNWNYTLKKIVAERDEVWVYGTYAGKLKKRGWGSRPGGRNTPTTRWTSSASRITGSPNTGT